MGFEEMVVAIVGTVLGVGFLGFVFARITGLIKAWIERNRTGYDEEAFDRLAKAFMQYKKDTERRLQNLETIIADDHTGSSPKQLEETHETIEIKDGKQLKSENRNLRNMLRNERL